MAALEFLLTEIHLLDPLGIIDLRIDLLLATAIRLHPADIGRAPHLVGIELIGLLVLMAIDVRVQKVVEGVSGLEAKFPGEVLLVEVSHEEEAIARLVQFSLFIIVYSAHSKRNKECGTLPPGCHRGTSPW